MTRAGIIVALAVGLLGCGPSAADKEREASNQYDADIQCLKLEMTGDADFGSGAQSRAKELACRQLIELRRRQR